MVILRVGLYLAVIAGLYVAWASAHAGYPPEVAVTRGVIGFMAAAFVAYLAELVVMTAPPPSVDVTVGLPDEQHDDEVSPSRLPAARPDRSVSADERRAA